MQDLRFMMQERQESRIMNYELRQEMQDAEGIRDKEVPSCWWILLSQTIVRMTWTTLRFAQNDKVQNPSAGTHQVKTSQIFVARLRHGGDC